jgi:hypothetical protein
MIEIGNVVYSNQHWGDRAGYFAVESAGSKAGTFTCRRIMKTDGTIIQKSKLRPTFDVIHLELMTPDKMQTRYDNSVKRALAIAQSELNHLLSNIK